MKERLEKAKKYVYEHSVEVALSVLAVLAIGTTAALVRNANNDLEQLDDPED